jgi:hypothetical protein
MTEQLLTLQEAAERGVTAIRKPMWAGRFDHMTFDTVRQADGTVHIGPWLRLYSPMNEAINGRDPVSILLTETGDTRDAVWLPYKGPSATSEEYLAERVWCNDCLPR